MRRLVAVIFAFAILLVVAAGNPSAAGVDDPVKLRLDAQPQPQLVLGRHSVGLAAQRPGPGQGVAVAQVGEQGHVGTAAGQQAGQRFAREPVGVQPDGRHAGADGGQGLPAPLVGAAGRADHASRFAQRSPRWAADRAAAQTPLPGAGLVSLAAARRGFDAQQRLVRAGRDGLR